AFQRYCAVDAASEWHDELENSSDPDEAATVDELERAVTGSNLVEAKRLFQANPELSRRVAMQFAFADGIASPALLHFIADEVERRYGDRTISAMLAPMVTKDREATTAFRKLVTQGAKLYEAGKF